MNFQPRGDDAHPARLCGAALLALERKVPVDILATLPVDASRNWSSSQDALWAANNNCVVRGSTPTGDHPSIHRLAISEQSLVKQLTLSVCVR